TTQTTQTILEDLSQIKDKLYRDLEQKLELTTEMTAEYKRMCFSLSILAFLLIATTIILFHRSKPILENKTNTYRP
ncbi:hypothetical protein NR990_15900, partial [Exiguobacterium artemiae]|nr:hypothetical protein [Exiguobacterium artemiae]